MVTKDNFMRIMKTQTEIALATSAENNPNVRIVNFYFDNVTNTLFFATFGDNEKVKEFESNPKVAFTTIPHSGNEHVKTTGCVQKSCLTIFDLTDHFINKIPNYKDIIDQAGQHLVLFEVKFDKAVVILDFENIETIHLK